MSSSTGSGAARSIAFISSGVTMGTSPPPSTASGDGNGCAPNGPSIGEAFSAPRATTTACATISEWLSVSRQPSTPCCAANAAARPVNESEGRPSSSRSTSISCQSAAPIPTPIAFRTASFAANRTAKRSVGSERRSAYSRSASVNSFLRSPGRRSSTRRKRSRSTRSFPIPRIMSASVRPASSPVRSSTQ